MLKFAIVRYLELPHLAEPLKIEILFEEDLRDLIEEHGSFGHRQAIKDFLDKAEHDIRWRTTKLT